MGNKWVDERGRMVGLAIAGNITSKSLFTRIDRFIIIMVWGNQVL